MAEFGEVGSAVGPGSPLTFVPLTRFFGRESERRELAQLLERERLVTLVGAPGCGKTRLARELGTWLADSYQAGVCFVELASIAQPASTVHAVAGALGVRDRPNQSVLATLVEELASRDILLVLDNCEHVRGAVADLSERLLHACPSARVLATSRVTLGVAGEQTWRVPPLDLDAAAELFRDRARLTAHQLPTGDDAGVVEQICRKLDGLPLAIELAAAWTGVLTPTEILDRLRRALPLPMARSRAPRSAPRQQTMEATLDWSYQLLGPSEQGLFERLCVFVDGFDLAAAQAVVSQDDVDVDVLAALAALIDHSLVVAETAADQVTRYRLLEPLRQCAEGLLARRGELEPVRRRHAQHYLDVALRSDVELRTTEPSAALGRLTREEGNLRAALELARAQPDELGLRLCTALGRWWVLRGRVNEGRAYLEEMLEVGTSDPRLRSSALGLASRLAWRQMDYRAARALLEGSLVIAEELGDRGQEARRLRSLAMVAIAQEDFHEAERLCRRSISIFGSQGDDYGRGLSLALLSLVLQLAGDGAAGQASALEALELSRSTGNVMGVVYSFAALLFAAVATDDVASRRASRTYRDEAIDLLRGLRGVLEDPGWLWTVIAFASAARRDHSALRLAGAVEERARRDGVHFPHLQRYVQPWLDDASLRVGRVEAARLTLEGRQLTVDEVIEECFRATADATEPDTGVGRAGHVGHPLSTRELEVAGLIAQGLANGEIAQRLFISKRTVESHVGHVKHKLGLERRSEIVAWVLDREAPVGVRG